MASAIGGSTIKNDFSIYQSYNKAIKTDEVYKNYDRLKEELDYEEKKINGCI